MKKIKTLNKLFLFIFILLIFTQCKKNIQDATPNKIDFSLEEGFEINSYTDSGEIIFVSPLDIRTDIEGNIFVSDKHEKSIKVFNKNGLYLFDIGRSGKGPGEFESTPVFDVIEQNKIIAIDERNRRVTKFSNKGEVLETISPDKNQMIWAKKFRALNRSKYIILRKLPEPDNLRDHESGFRSSVMHIFDENFSNRVTSFGYMDSLLNTEREFVKLYNVSINVGSFWSDLNKEILFVPGIYEGNIFRFDLNNNDWKLVSVLEGYIKSKEPVTFFTGQNSPEAAITFNVFSGGGPYSGIINSQSLGIFSLENNDIIHFSSQFLKGKRITIIELFNPEGNLLGIGEIEDLNHYKSTRESHIKAIWKDENDRFYFIEEREYSTIRVGKIDYK